MKISVKSTKTSRDYFSHQKLDGRVKGNNENTSSRSSESFSNSNPSQTHTSRSSVDVKLVSEPVYHRRPTTLYEYSSAISLSSTSSGHIYSLCRKDGETSFCSSRSSHKSIAHDQCRTQCSTAQYQGPDHTVLSHTRRTKRGIRCYHSKWTQLCRTSPCSTIFGFLNGLFLSLRKRSCGGISRIICLTILIAYLYLPLSYAAPRHKLRRLQTNYSRATEMNELITLLRKLDEQTSVGEEQYRRSMYYRRPTRTGRSGRRRVTASPTLEPAVKASLIQEEIRSASCKPRDTILDAFKETGTDRGYDRLVPECVVVPRCHNGGCCMEHQECTSAGSELKTFYFLHNQQITSRQIRLDTSCECQDKSPYCRLSQDNCTRGMIFDSSQCKCVCQYKCPEPFLQIDNCQCDCLMSDRRCKNFFRGKKGLSLTKSQCDCVQQGECIIPPCANGRFSMHHCRCINSSS